MSVLGPDDAVAGWTLREGKKLLLMILKLIPSYAVISLPIAVIGLYIC